MSRGHSIPVEPVSEPVERSEPPEEASLEFEVFYCIGRLIPWGVLLWISQGLPGVPE